MAAGRLRGLRGGLAVSLALGLMLPGCRTTPIGQALFGPRTEPTPSSTRLVAFLRIDRTPDAIATSTPPAEQSQDGTAWRSVQAQGSPAASDPSPADPQVANTQPEIRDEAVTQVAWHSREDRVEFDGEEPEADRGGNKKDDKDNDRKADKDTDKTDKEETAPQPRAATVQQVPVGPEVPFPQAAGMHPNAVPRELHKMSLPAYTVEPPDILLIESSRGLPTQPVRGQHLVRPDGTVNLGIYGSVYVTGLTLEQVKAVVAPAIASRLDKAVLAKNPVKPEDVNVDVLAYNSRVYYVITDGAGYGEQVVRVPVTGNETVLDAIAQINGLPAVSSKKHIWVARRTPGHGPDQILPVDWCGITQRGESGTNYQLFPGDRVYVKAQKIITIDATIAKVLSPIERLLGVTLLASETVNSIRGTGSGVNGR
jgi:polysaccharide export outer membrane protein